MPTPRHGHVAADNHVIAPLHCSGRADGVFVCPDCGTAEPVSEQRMAIVADLLRTDRKRGAGSG